ncbi:unnamed protein product [Pleuronectes platessa]|uniref:Uncharacterized protein n=1 Tax=Pleuronectes platessa TaxID=8262 RepID=A0A9N7V066_PLEPL|nr:unnamed protein product [Pleuronectes platessa]
MGSIGGASNILSSSLPSVSHSQHLTGTQWGEEDLCFGWSSQRYNLLFLLVPPPSERYTTKHSWKAAQWIAYCCGDGVLWAAVLCHNLGTDSGWRIEG